MIGQSPKFEDLLFFGLLQGNKIQRIKGFFKLSMLVFFEICYNTNTNN